MAGGRIRASAPVRICDVGGWTDTWYGGPGRVLNVAVSPGVEVTMVPAAAAAGGGGPRDPLVQAAIDEYPPPEPVDVVVGSGVPPGSGMGTSAAVAVAMVGALAAASGEHLSAMEAARRAHRLETVVLGGESGVQDHMAAAFGGVGYIEVDSYPTASVETLAPWPEMTGLLTAVYLGKPHASSEVHREVIESGAAEGVLDRLREAAVEAREAVVAQNLKRFGAAMRRNCTAQAELHPSVVSAAARAVISGASSCGAIGWKVNGAGGDGGSMTVLSPSPASRQWFEKWVDADGRFSVIRVDATSRGLVVEGKLLRPC